MSDRDVSDITSVHMLFSGYEQSQNRPHFNETWTGPTYVFLSAALFNGATVFTGARSAAGTPSSSSRSAAEDREGRGGSDAGGGDASQSSRRRLKKFYTVSDVEHVRAPTHVRPHHRTHRLCPPIPARPSLPRPSFASPP